MPPLDPAQHSRELFQVDEIVPGQEPVDVPVRNVARAGIHVHGEVEQVTDREPSARSRRARLTWLLTHDRRLDASTREAATALIEACEHLGVLLWPDAETA